MSITKEEVLKVANLARLELADDEIDMFSKQINQILGYIDTLNSVDTTGVSATSHAVPLNNVFREDKHKEHLDREEALSNAPDKEDGFFVVPRIL